jgi:hypothetical protein
MEDHTCDICKSIEIKIWGFNDKGLCMKCLKVEKTKQTQTSSSAQGGNTFLDFGGGGRITVWIKKLINF